MSDSPAVIIFDINGNPVALVNGDSVSASTPGLVVSGSDGYVTHHLRTTADGTLRIDPTGATVQPVSLTTIPLPTGAATETTLALLLSSSTFTARVNTLGQKTMTASTPVTLASDQSALAVTGTFWQATQPVSGTFFQATQPVSAVALPLPAGAATEATLALIKAKTDNLDVALSTRAITGLTNTELRASAVPVSGTFWQATQPVSGTVTANAGTGTFAVSAASLPLPSGAATEITLATLLSETTFTNRTPTIGQKTMAGSTPVTIASDQGALAVSGTFFQATQPVSAAALPLPAGASTEATLALIKAKTDNLDVALSTRAVTGLTDTQLRAAPIPVSGTFYQATQPVSGTVTANAGSGTFAVSAVDLPLPTGAATEATLTTKLSESTFTSRINTLGQKSMAASTPVVLASNQSAIPVTVVSGEATNSNLKVAYDIADTVIYVGTAELASSTASAVWTIKKTTLVGGLPVFVEWSDANAIWDDRATESYS